MNGRNQRCSCGSGKKAKFCCRKPKPLRPLPNEADRRSLWEIIAQEQAEAETMQLALLREMQKHITDNPIKEDEPKSIKMLRELAADIAMGDGSSRLSKTEIQARLSQIMYRKFVEESVTRLTEYMRKALAPIPEGSYQCCRCGKIEQLTTPREEMLEEMHRVFGPDAKPEDCGIACDECWEHIKPERNPEQYSKFLAEQTNNSTND